MGDLRGPLKNWQLVACVRECQRPDDFTQRSLSDHGEPLTSRCEHFPYYFLLSRVFKSIGRGWKETMGKKCPVKEDSAGV